MHDMHGKFKEFETLLFTFTLNVNFFTLNSTSASTLFGLEYLELTRSSCWNTLF